MLVALHVGILLVREWVCVVGFSENVTIWGCIDKLVFLVIIFLMDLSYLLIQYWVSTDDCSQPYLQGTALSACVSVCLEAAVETSGIHSYFLLFSLFTALSVSTFLLTISITHYLPFWLYIYLLKCPVSFKNELSLSGLCRFTLLISRIVSNEEVNMTVSVRDSPGEIRAGNSSERDDNFN